MTKRIFCTALALFIMVMSFTQSVLAATENVVIKPEYTEDTAVSVSFKDGQSGGAQYVYTGDKVKPEVIVTKTDKTVAAPSEYKITYDDNCNELGVHFINVEYLKSGYTVMLDYYVVPGKTSISMSAKNGVVTLSWSSVKGATCYRVYEYKGGYVELPWENGALASSKQSRSFSDLQPGKTYKFGVMALASPDSMPTNYMATIEFTVPENGNTDTEKTTQATTVKATVTTTKAATTKAAEEIQVVATATTTQATTEAPTTEATTLPESTELTETTTQKETKAQAEKPTEDSSAEDNSSAKIIIPVIAGVVVAAGGAVGFVVIRKKKNKA